MRTYNVAIGHLILEHNYHHPTESGNTVIAVDINPLLESVTSEELRVGAWVNVLGYVRKQAQVSGNSKDYIEAVMVFPAGAVALGEYQRIVRDAQDVDLARGV